MFSNALYRLTKPVRAVHASELSAKSHEWLTLPEGSEVRIHKDRHRWSGSDGKFQREYFYSISIADEHYEALAPDLEDAVLRVLDDASA